MIAKPAAEIFQTLAAMAGFCNSPGEPKSICLFHSDGWQGLKNPDLC
jgi:hypothetical protein